MSGEFDQIRQFVAAEILATGGSSPQERAKMVAKAALEWIADETGKHAVEVAYQLVDEIVLSGRD